MSRASQRRPIAALVAIGAFALGATLPDAFGQPEAAPAAFAGRNGPIAFRSDAFVAGRESHAIWRIAPDGTGARRMTRGFDPVDFEIDYSPVFFPDGRRFAYVRQVADEDFAVQNQIYVKAASAPPNALGSPVLPAPVDYKILSLAVSPDGRRLALAAAPPPLEATQIFTLSLDSGEMTQLTSGSAPARTPEFSPDGRRIVFARRHHGKGGLFAIGPEGSGLRQLTARPGDGSPSYSPSGDRIAFNGHSGRHIRIFSIRAGGGDRTELTHGPFADHGPAFSPDGREIVFSRFARGQSPDLYAMRADGTGAHLLFAGRGRHTSDFGSDWGPRPR